MNSTDRHGEFWSIGEVRNVCGPNSNELNLC